MVTFTMKNNDQRKAVYHYFPEGDTKEDYGEITIDFNRNIIKVTKPHKDDVLKVVSKDSQWYVYGSHAIKKISKEYNDTGALLTEGKVMWY